MNDGKKLISHTIHTVLAVGMATGVCAALPALGQTTSGAKKQKPKTLQAVIVTGSHIRRPEVENDNPVIAVSAQRIKQTGAMTLGAVMDQLPALIGAGTNPNDNTDSSASPGPGATLVGLRDLGPQRTLILVDGQRVINSDLNSIPTVAIQRVEILASGASAVYGSDAIGGAINIILKKHYQGAQVTANFGLSNHHGDSKRMGGSFMFGQVSDKGSILAGVSYNKANPLLHSQRKFSAEVRSITGSTNTPVHSFVGGSSFAARDFITAPDTVAEKFGCTNGRNLSLNATAFGAGTSPTTSADYHCFDPESDRYNFAASTLFQIPQERTNAFFRGVYHITNNIDLSATIYNNHTTSEFQIAPDVWGTNFGAANISKFSIFNPFGVSFTPTNGNTYMSRLVSSGDRIGRFSDKTNQGMFAVRGHVGILGKQWTWDIGYNYGHISQGTAYLGIANIGEVIQGVGPSMLVGGVPTCVSTPGDPTTRISGCVPWDPFNLNSASARKVLSAAASPALTNSWSIERIKHADATGGLFSLPAGVMQLAVGVSWRDEYTDNALSPGLLVNPNTNTCPLGSECSSHLQGGFSVKEAYGELFVPIVKNLPFVHGLNVTLGDRYSKYSTFGSTDNWKIGMEYRPVQGLLLRGTVSEVFRAPTIGDVFGAPGIGGATITHDPCDGITVANPACVGVPLNGSFVNSDEGVDVTTVIGSGSKFAHFPVNIPRQSRGL